MRSYSGPVGANGATWSAMGPVPGDGRVRRTSGVPPADHGIPHRVVETTLAHMELVCDNVAQVVALAVGNSTTLQGIQRDAGW